MRCELCAGDTAPRRVRKQHWHKGRLYIVENVETEVCQECGERYFQARTLDRIDALIQGDHEVKQLLSVEVLSA
jgi:YgiT-type zinc finger domain-containing protein